MYQILGVLPPPKLVRTYQCGKGDQGYKIYNLSIGCDIETTNNRATRTAFMWVWSINFNGVPISGRTWQDFFDCLEYLKAHYKKADLMIFIHNLPFEASFLLPRLDKMDDIERVFATDIRQVIEIRTKSGYIYRDTAVLSGMSLKALADNFCETKKAVGDLDYNIPRNSNTPIKQREWHYIYNDTRILFEYGLQVHHEYTENKQTIPLTATGKVRRTLKNTIGSKYIHYVKERMYELYPKSEDEYKLLMMFLFRGGYVHAQTAACGKVWENIDSWDEVSAYPAVMLQERYPMGPFEEFAPEMFDYYYKKPNIAIYGMFTFYNIHSKTAHCIESKHKVISEQNAFYENGRLSCAAEITVLITEIDYKLYKMFYKWENKEVHWCKKTYKKPLPKYLRETVEKLYIEKYEIKQQLAGMEKEGKEETEEYKTLYKKYMVVKGKVNACYGMTVSRLNMHLYSYKGGQWVKENQKKKDGTTKTYDDYIQEQLLSPYWGIYITAYARERVLSVFLKCGRKALYGDTDSGKVTHGCDDIFIEHNKKIEAINKMYCTTYNLNFEIFKNLGCFEKEATYRRFKTLGAKRYIYTVIKDGAEKFKVTVAGMPKEKLSQALQDKGVKKGFKFFDDGMKFEDSGKLTHVYHDETTAIIDGEEMHELGGCYLEPAPFCMTIADAFLQTIHIRQTDEL